MTRGPLPPDMRAQLVEVLARVLVADLERTPTCKSEKMSANVEARGGAK